MKPARVFWFAIAAWVAVVAALVTIRIQERALTSAGLLDQARADSITTLQRQADSLNALLKVAVPAAVKWRTRWDSIINVDTLERTDTVRVPVEVLVTADSAIQACHATLSPCLALASGLTQERDLWQRRYESALKLRNRSWTAAGVSYDPGQGTATAWVDRDVWRIRLGLEVVPASDGVRARIRAGWRW